MDRRTQHDLLLTGDIVQKVRFLWDNVVTTTKVVCMSVNASARWYRDRDTRESTRIEVILNYAT